MTIEISSIFILFERTCKTSAIIMMYPFRPRRKIQSVQTVRTAICMYPFEQSIHGRTAASVKGTACASCFTESKSNIVWRANGKRHDNVARRGPSVRPAAPADSGCSTESAIPGKIAGRGRALASPIEGPTAKPTSECRREGPRKKRVLTTH